MIEREIKLRFQNADEARAAVTTAGGRLVASRRLIEDRLFDTPDGHLRTTGRALRVRRDGARALLTSKAPAPSGLAKAREEFETEVGHAGTVEAILGALGYARAFLSQKYREEYRLGDVIAAVDETPIGVFVELEGPEAGIVAAARLLDRGPAEYLVDSYPALYFAWCRRRGHEPGNMVFETPVADSTTRP